jgi:hypothetical protein
LTILLQRYRIPGYVKGRWDEFVKGIIGKFLKKRCFSILTTEAHRGLPGGAQRELYLICSSEGIR